MAVVFLFVPPLPRRGGSDGSGGRVPAGLWRQRRWPAVQPAASSQQPAASSRGAVAATAAAVGSQRACGGSGGGPAAEMGLDSHVAVVR